MVGGGRPVLYKGWSRAFGSHPVLYVNLPPGGRPVLYEGWSRALDSALYST